VKVVRYLGATRHPWPSLLFLLPLLLAYEAGIVWLGGRHPEALRNGADTWMRWGLGAFGLSQLYWPPVLIVVVFTAWSWGRRGDRPQRPVLVGGGIAVESAAFAFGLWGLSRGLGPLLDHLGVSLSTGSPRPAPPPEFLRDLITFVGAGIYEELLFRLVLFTGLVWALRLADLPVVLALVLATLTSAVLFSAAHHVGPHGEVFDSYVFLFRTLAGLYFTLLYVLRGFGVAVGAHAFYDVLVGVLVR
jgi:hypothetical protein